MAIKGIPSSISQSVRTIVQNRLVRLVVRLPRVPTQDDPNVFSDVNVGYGTPMMTRRMVQKNNTSVFYEFLYPPVQASYDGITPEIVEIPRPLLQPLVEKKAQRNYRVEFEFLVSNQFDGLLLSVEDQLRVLEYMANSGELVYFENFDTFLISGYWYIAEFRVQASRRNTDGKIAAAQCSIGLIEYSGAPEVFQGFPRISYQRTRKKSDNARNRRPPNGNCSETISNIQDRKAGCPDTTYNLSFLQRAIQAYKKGYRTVGPSTVLAQRPTTGPRTSPHGNVTFPSVTGRE